MDVLASIARCGDPHLVDQGKLLLDQSQHTEKHARQGVLCDHICGKTGFDDNRHPYLHMSEEHEDRNFSMGFLQLKIAEDLEKGEL